jgi:hypothetical protein
MQRLQTRLSDKQQVENEGTILRYARAGTIPSVRIGDDVYFDPNQIASWIRNLLNPSATPAKGKPS